MQRWVFSFTCQGSAPPVKKNRAFQRKPSTIFLSGPCPLCPSQPLFLGIIKFKPLKQNRYGTVRENLHRQRQQNQGSGYRKGIHSQGKPGRNPERPHGGV